MAGLPQIISNYQLQRPGPNPKRPELTPPHMSVDVLATAVRSLDADACDGGLLERHGPARHAGAVLNAEHLVREFLYMS